MPGSALPPPQCVAKPARTGTASHDAICDQGERGGGKPGFTADDLLDTLGRRRLVRIQPADEGR